MTATTTTTTTTTTTAQTLGQQLLAELTLRLREARLPGTHAELARRLRATEGEIRRYRYGRRDPDVRTVARWLAAWTSTGLPALRVSIVADADGVHAAVDWAKGQGPGAVTNDDTSGSSRPG